VVPRVSANGNVIIDVEQESSSVTPGSAGSLAPTISDRRVKSSISVASGQTVLLAGLISDETDRQRQGIPVLDKIPGIGDLFSQQSSTKVRTELIIFIRPTVIRDAVDAHMVAEELRSKLNGEQVGGNFPGLHNGPVLHPWRGHPGARQCIRHRFDRCACGWLELCGKSRLARRVRRGARLADAGDRVE